MRMKLGSSPPSPSDFLERSTTPEDVNILFDLCSRGDLEGAQGILSSYKKSPGFEAVGLRRCYSSLAVAVLNRDTPLVAYLLSEGIAEEIGFPICEALEARHKLIFQLLLDLGWDINSPPHGRLDTIPLWWILDNPELVDWFLDRGASPNARGLVDKTPLSHAVQHYPIELIKKLLHHGGTVEHGQLLHHAVLRAMNHEEDDVCEVVEMLIRLGSPINEVKYSKDPPSFRERQVHGLGTALHRAVEFGKAKVVKMLLDAGADREVLDTTRNTALYWAESKKHEEVVQLFREPWDDPQSTPESRLLDWEKMMKLRFG